MGVIKNLKTPKMKFLCLLVVVAVASADLFVVDVSEDVAAAGETGPSDRTIICNFFGNSRCTTACSVNLVMMPALGIVDSEELDQFYALLWPQQHVSPLLLLLPAKSVHTNVFENQYHILSL